MKRSDQENKSEQFPELSLSFNKIDECNNYESKECFTENVAV